MLMICGMYQMFGAAFITADKTTIPGIGILDVTTKSFGAALSRQCGVRNERLWPALLAMKTIVAGRSGGATILPLGSVPTGQEMMARPNRFGARFNNVFGSYMHGPMLAKAQYLQTIYCGLRSILQECHYANSA